MAFVNETLTEQDKEWFVGFRLESEFRKGALARIFHQPYDLGA